MNGLIASLPPLDPLGGYMSLEKIIIMLVLLVPWMFLAPWAQRDARDIKLQTQAVGAMMFAGGAIGMLIWILTPLFYIGLAIYVVLVASTTLGYVFYRNTKVALQYRLLSRDHFRSAFTKDATLKVKTETRLKIYDASGRLAGIPDEGATIEEKTAYNAAQALLYDLLYYRASEADLAPAGEESKLRLLVDGAIVSRPTLNIEDSELVVQYIKGLAGLDMTERRKPQQGRISVDMVNQPVDMLIITAGTTHGQRMQFRIIQESIHTKIDELGMPDDILAKIQAANQIGPGLILVSARPKNGLTSTLYSLLKCHDSFTLQLSTLESSVTFELDNVSQDAYQGDPEAERKQLVSTLRHDPHVVMIDQCPDANVAAEIVKAAAERLIIAGVTASDTFTALAKWIQRAGDAAAAMTSLKIVLSQVLVRKLCPECREGYRPDPSLLAKANISADAADEFFRPPTKPRLDDKGKPLVDADGNPIPCETCRGAGYFGRVGVFELLEVTDQLRQLVAEGASLSKIKAACRKDQMLYLQEQALQKVITGITSVQEVIRVTQPSTKTKSKS